MLPNTFYDFSASELAEELESIEDSIRIWQASIVEVRKKLDRAMRMREDLIDLHRQKAQEERSYKRS
jgi:phage shock protein A